jgi:two-component system cell cycle sensor histidine kinase PleC
MAKADAWGAPEGNFYARHTAARRASSGVTGHARIIAAPAYKRLLAAEPILRNLIPFLIIVFLVVIAGTRCLSLMTHHEEVERSAKGLLGLAAGQMGYALTAAQSDGPLDAAAFDALIEDIATQGSIGNRHALMITDDSFVVQAATQSGSPWIGRQLESFIGGGQPLFLFGSRAGVMEVRIADEVWYAAMGIADGRQGAAIAMIAQDAVFADWRKTVTLNVTLFAATAAVLLVILYAYFGQAARAQAADRLYLEAHNRVDLALVRGRCGLWDWDMVRGRMYWSRSMYDMLGYEASEAMLSFGSVSEIIHPTTPISSNSPTASSRAKSTRSTGLPHAARRRPMGLDSRKGTGERSRRA